MRRLILTLYLAGVVGAAPAWSRNDQDTAGLPRPVIDAVQEAPLEAAAPPRRIIEKTMTPSEAARQVQRRYGGRVLAVQSDGPGFRVKVLKNGEVRVYQVNP